MPDRASAVNHEEVVAATRRRSGETTEVFAKRLTTLLPNFPADVLRQWLVENSGVLRDFPWLDPLSLSFRSETWPTQRVLSEIKHWYEPGVEMEVTKFSEWSDYRATYPLANYVFENGTWPVAPIVFDNIGTKPILWGGGTARFVMLEGMHRFGFLRALHHEWPDRLLRFHTVWLALDGKDQL